MLRFHVCLTSMLFIMLYEHENPGCQAAILAVAQADLLHSEPAASQQCQPKA